MIIQESLYILSEKIASNRLLFFVITYFVSSIIEIKKPAKSGLLWYQQTVDNENLYWLSRLRLTKAEINRKRTSLSGVGIVIHVSPIFTLRRQSTIFGTTGLNFRVREKRSPKSPAFWRKDEGRSDTRADRKICSQWAKSARTWGGPPASSTPTVDNEILLWLPQLDLSCDNSVNSRVLYRVSYGQICQ